MFLNYDQLLYLNQALQIGHVLRGLQTSTRPDPSKPQSSPENGDYCTITIASTQHRVARALNAFGHLSIF